MDIKEEFILFLEGIYINDYIDIDQQFNNRLIDNNEYQMEEKKIIYDKIPSKFTSLDNWEPTNIKCWFCFCSFKNLPIFIPKEIYNTDNGKVMDVYGNFCSFGCAKAFLNFRENIDEDKYWDYNEMLKMLYKIFYNKKIYDIKASPSQYNLVWFGGNLTMKDYKKSIIDVDDININNSI